jgi:hypothetical protein
VVTSASANSPNKRIFMRFTKQRFSPFSRRRRPRGLGRDRALMALEHAKITRPIGRRLLDIVAVGSLLRGTEPQVERRAAAIGLANLGAPSNLEA